MPKLRNGRGKMIDFICWPSPSPLCYRAHSLARSKCWSPSIRSARDRRAREDVTTNRKHRCKLSSTLYRPLRLSDERIGSLNFGKPQHTLMATPAGLYMLIEVFESTEESIVTDVNSVRCVDEVTLEFGGAREAYERARDISLATVNRTKRCSPRLQ